MYFICEHCGYQFENKCEVEQCPDCGKYKVRVATDSEINEYIERKNSFNENLSEDI